MEARVLVAGSGNVTGMNVVRALVGNVDNLLGYDCCPTKQNPANAFCANECVPKASDSAYVPAVLELARKHRMNLIIASNDHEVRTLAENINQFKAAGITVNAMTPLTLMFMNKLETSELFVQHGIPTPEVLNDMAARPPYVLRKQYVGQGQKFTHVIRSYDDENALAHRLPESGSVYTRYIHGIEYTVDILAWGGEATAIVPRLRHEVRHGMVHFSEVVNDPEVIDWSRKLTMSFQLDGMYCVQCIKNADGCFFFEVNPRPGSGTDLSIAAGVNLPLLWVDQQLGLTVPLQEPVWGTKMVRYQSGYYFK